MCGEDKWLAANLQLQSETPPRVWGRPLSDFRLRGEWGNTPTCVGKTWCGGSDKFWHQKHPHVCGEDHFARFSAFFDKETPPRVWGRHQRKWRKTFFRGNTPTCVGKTTYCSHSYKRLRKHPHVCGEDTYKPWHEDRYIETPPRVWGRLCTRIKSAFASRNTPTCVGKTKPPPILLNDLGKHPHVCGEDYMCFCYHQHL